MLKKSLILFGVTVLVLAGLAIAFDIPRFLWGIYTYGGQRTPGKLSVGDPVPDTTLHDLDTGAERRLTEWIIGKPLVLIFGSCTWPPFRRSVERLEELAAKHADSAQFLTVYIKEAHPNDEWQMRANERENLIYDQPKTLNDRLTIARDFVHRMEYDLEVVVDSMDNVANEAFAAWPERLYIVDTNGKVAYKGRMGPEGFVVDEVERWLDQNLDDAS